jgi:hypothetical protein
MAQRNPHTGPPSEVAAALEVLAANPEAARASGIFDPSRLDDILENQVVPALRAIRSLLEMDRLPSDGEVPAGGIMEVLQDIRRNTSAVVAPEFNKDNLPLDTVGETTEVLTEGDSGEALFDIEGSTFVAEVTATAQIGAFDPIRITRQNNVVEPIPEDVQVPERRTAPRYITSGEDPIDVTNTEFETFEIEDEDGQTLVADTVVLFFDEDIDVSFTTDDEDQVIPLTADRSPASFSSVQGVRATQVLYRQMTGAAAAAELNIIAFK